MTFCWRTDALAILAIMAVNSYVYSTVFTYPLTELDDLHGLMQAQKSIWQGFTSDFQGHSGRYRPLIVVAFFINHKLSGYSGVAYHAMNFSLWLTMLVTFYIFMRRVNVRPVISLSGILILSFLWSSSVVVVWASDVGNLMAGLGLGLLLNLLISTPRRTISGIVTWSACYSIVLMAVILAKESGLAVLIVLTSTPLVMLALKLDNPVLQSTRLSMVVVGVTTSLLYLIMRVQAIPSTAIESVSVVQFDSILRVASNLVQTFVPIFAEEGLHLINVTPMNVGRLIMHSFMTVCIVIALFLHLNSRRSPTWSTSNAYAMRRDIVLIVLMLILCTALVHFPYFRYRNLFLSGICYALLTALSMEFLIERFKDFRLIGFSLISGSLLLALSYMPAAFATVDHGYNKRQRIDPTITNHLEIPNTLIQEIRLFNKLPK